jgi:hypothetical protein
MISYLKLFPPFPPLSIHTKSDFGQTMTTERKRYSPAGKYPLSGNDQNKIKGEKSQ